MQEDEFIVLATDGIFQVFKNEEILSIVRKGIGINGETSSN